jgi:HlyD family secretion protein
MKRFTRFLLRGVTVLAVLAVVILILVFWYSDDQSNAPGNVFQTVAVSRGGFERTVSSTGTLAAVETVTVGTEVSGTVEKVLVDYNDRVTKGQVLAFLKPDLFNAAVADAQGAVDQALAGQELARQELERNRPLFDQGYLSAQEFLPYRINLDKADAAVASARAGVTRARTNRANATIHSPIDGTVIQRSIDAGQTVAASLNTPTLFIIARDLAKMQIEAAVDETDIGQIRTGLQVRFSVQSYPDKTFSGIVRQVRLQPTTVQNVVTYTVIVAADNDQGLLLPGMTATVDFIVEAAQDVLLVPNAALRFRPAAKKPSATTKNPTEQQTKSGERVFILSGDGGLRRVPVTIGSSDGQQTLVTEGDLQEGALVVTGIKPEASKPKSSFSLFGAMRGRPRR